jgi:hypothetical protein
MARKKPDSSGKLQFKDSEFLQIARGRFKFADEADTDQRQRERDDLAFYAGDQWPSDIYLARQGQQPVNGMAAVPSRPTLVIDNLREPVSQVINEGASSDLGIEITAAEDFGDLGVMPDAAEIKVREGLTRKIQRESQARDARLWAFDRAVKAGRGYYQILTRYLPGKTFDQELYIHRIYNQSSVLLDPSHEEPDGSDAKWGFVCVDMLWEDYKAKFPKAANGKANWIASATLSDQDWDILGDQYPKWFKRAESSKATSTSSRVDQDTRAVRVVDYWYTVQESNTLCLLADGRNLWDADVPSGYPRLEGDEDLTPDDFAALDPNTVVDARPVMTQKIKWAKIDGAQVLEETNWDGPDLPIIKVVGEELQPYDGERRSEGMVRPSRDSQKGLNYMISKQVEMVGLTPLTPLIGDPDATEGYPEWDLLNTRVVPMARYRSYDDQGRPLKEPHRPNADPNLLPISQSIALFSAQVEKQTRVPAARLGDIDPVTRSGKALDRLTSNSKNSTSGFMSNLVRSVRYEGQILNNLLYPIYGTRPGRLVRIMTGKGESQLIAIHDNPQQATPQEIALLQKAASVAKLTPDATFNINIKVTRDYDTRKMEESQQIGELLSADPQLLTWFGDLWFGNMDGPGHEELADRTKAMLAPPIQALLAAKAQGQAPPSPREQQLQQQLQHVSGQLQQATQIIQTKQIETQAKGEIDLQKTHLQETYEMERNRADNETKIAVAELGAKVDRLALFMEERGRLGLQVSDANEADAQRQHEVGMAGAQAGMDQQAQAAQQLHEQQQAATAAAQPAQNGSGA